MKTNRWNDTPCGRVLTAAEIDLRRPLSLGEAADLLFDNFPQIADSAEAHEIAWGCLIRPPRSSDSLDAADMLHDGQGPEEVDE